MTAVIQSSTATIVITSGLVGAGIISLSQSLGIVIGANVGTTVTGQIIRLLDLNASGTSFLQFLKPSTLAPLALIVGIVLIMVMKSNESEKAGQIVIGYMVGAGVAFVLQSSSATIGILQAFSTSGQLTFGSIYAVLVGIYLGDCITTAIVCNIGAKPNAKRVGIVNILYNLGKSAAVLIVVTIIHKMGLLDGIWSGTIDSGGIANTNTIFNLLCAIILFPALKPFEMLSHKIVRDVPVAAGIYDEMLDALNPVFISTPAIAFGRCYDVLMVMYGIARTNIERAFELITEYDEQAAAQIVEDEDDIDLMAVRVSNYLIQISWTG